MARTERLAESVRVESAAAATEVFMLVCGTILAVEVALEVVGRRIRVPGRRLEGEGVVRCTSRLGEA